MFQVYTYDGWSLVDKLLLIFYNADFEFADFGKNGKHEGFCWLTSKLSIEDLISARFTGESIDVENFNGSRKSVLYKKDKMEILQQQLLNSGNEELLFHSHNFGYCNGFEGRYPSINSIFLEMFIEER